MAYTTIAIVREESAFKDDALVIDAYITRAIAQADSFIDGKIGAVYLLPLSEVPALIQDCSTTLAIYNLIKDQNLNIEIASGVNIFDAIQDKLAILEQLLNRKLKLFDSAGLELEVIDLIKPSGFPTKAATESGAAVRQFTIDQKY